MRADELVEQVQLLLADGDVPAEYAVQVQVGDRYYPVEAVTVGADGLVIEASG